ncbi:MAG: hypothetical protein AB1601_10725 [Planctomycetota bacterium]
MTLDVYDDEGGAAAGGPPCPYVGILFECCGVYVRVYRRPEQKYYRGRCPKCLRAVRLRIGRDGTDARLFRAR